MTENRTIERVAPRLPAPTRVGQATAVEQSRAAAEVQAAVVVAQQCPRDVQAARLAMQDSCAQVYLAEKAFYRYPRGGQQVTGESIHLARELARCWGNVQYGIAELSRDDDHGQSEMMAFAWDVQTNSRTSTTFIVPHKSDRSGGAKVLTDMRDIYENNANMGARRVREMILAILPPWFVEEAKELCNRTLAGGGGKPLAQLVSEVIEGFASSFEVSPDQLEQKVGQPRDRWNAYDVAQLRVIWRSIRRRETSVEDEFPAPRVTPEEIASKATTTTAEPSPSEPETAEDGDTTTTDTADWPEVAKPGSGGEDR